MSKTLTWEPTAEEAAQLEAQISYYLGEMQRLNEQMARDQEKIDSLKLETHLIAAETRTAMDTLQERLAELRVS
jgi:predicted  nucleic acid-binding Zn-ribbon protein